MAGRKTLEGERLAGFGRREFIAGAVAAAGMAENLLWQSTVAIRSDPVGS